MGEVVSERIDTDSTGGMGGYLVRPVEPGRYPGVLVGAEIFGITGQVRAVADRLAGLGFVVLAPDFYHRTEPGAELDADRREHALGLMRGLTRPEVVEDLRAATGYLRRRADTTERTGMVGFSLGGHIAYLAATQLDLAAVAALYPGWLPSTNVKLSRPEPTLDLTGGITGRVLLLFAGRDHLITADQRDAIARRLKDEGVQHELVTYPDARHGFFFPGRETYHEASANDAFARVRDLLQELR